MNSILNEKRKAVIKHILKLDDDRLAILLLIHISRYQNLFLHEISDWKNSPTSWITKDQRVQDEVIGLLSFIILFSLTNAHHDRNLYKSNRKDIKEMQLEDFLDNSIYNSPYKNFLNKKITISSISLFFKIPKESVRRYLNSIIEAGLVIKDTKYGYLVSFDAYQSYIFTESVSNIIVSLMKSLIDIIKNLEDYFKVDFNFDSTLTVDVKNLNQVKWNRVRLHLYHFWVRILTFDGNDKSLIPADRIILSAAVYFQNTEGILRYNSIEKLYESGHLLPTNISSISEASKMPRETVRRCSKKLIELNHLRKKGRNIYRVGYPKETGEIKNLIKYKKITFNEMMNFYFNIYDDILN